MAADGVCPGLGYPVSKTAVTSLKLLHHVTRSHPIQLKSVPENEAKRFCFALTLLPSIKVKVTRSGKRWKKSTVPIIWQV